MDAVISQTGMEPPIAAPAPPPAPAPQAPAPRQAAPQQPHAVRPLINTSGQQVDTFGRPVKGNDEIDMTGIEDFMAGGKSKPAKPTEPNDDDDASPPAPAPTPAPAAKKPDEPAKEPDSPFAQQPVPAAAPAAKRDYSQLPPEIANYAKKLPNQVFENLTNTYKQFQADLQAERAAVEQLKLERDAAATKATFDHPDAYQIDPNYRTVVQNYGRVQLEANHYTEQLARIDQGEAWSYISGYDQAGNPQYVEVPAAADGRVDYGSRAKIIAGLTQLNTQQQQLQLQAQQIQREYANSAQTVQQHYAEAQKRLFPNLDPTKLTEEREKQAYEFAIKALPPTEQRRPSAQMLGLAAVAVIRMGTQLRDALDKVARYERLGATARAAAPVRVAPQPMAVDASDEEIPLDNPLNLPSRY